MTALAEWAFAHVAPQLELRGFDTLPISLPRSDDPDAGKKPPSSLTNWSTPAPVARRLPYYARCGVGVLTRSTPAVDCDVMHVELAEAIDRMVMAEIGDGPVRIGQAPKRLRVCRTETPFPKISTRAYRLPSDEPGAKAHKVEILADGQQFVAYGNHPVTGRQYAWPFDSLLNLERDDLPELTAETAARVIAKAEAILARAGTVVSARPRQSQSAGPHRPGPAPRSVRDLTEARQVLDTLATIDPSGLDYDTWIATAYGVKAALGEHGKSAWIAWSSRSTKHGSSGRSDTPARMWSRINPQRCGWRFLERLAGEIAGGR